MNILVVDDDYLLAKGTAKLIERLGNHEVLICDNPQEIVQKCKAQEIDVVLMDVNLPGAYWEDEEITGADLSRLLKNDPDTSHIPIILITAYAMLSERQKLLEISQADDFCSKPITDYDSLLASINRLYEASQQQSQS